jgi:hypothetical protein
VLQFESWRAELGASSWGLNLKTYPQSHFWASGAFIRPQYGHLKALVGRVGGCLSARPARHLPILRLIHKPISGKVVRNNATTTILGVSPASLSKKDAASADMEPPAYRDHIVTRIFATATVS